MEGPWKVWRHQRIENNSPDLDSYGKPLPSPPPGYYWERLIDKSWELKKYQGPTSTPETIIFEAPVVIEHVILPSDTLQGICLRYRISAVALRQYNNFSGSAFRSKRYLRIPIEPGYPVNVQLSSEQTLIQRFKNESGESEREARFYLEGHNWNLLEALAEWSGDEKWMSQQLPISVFNSTPIAPSQIITGDPPIAQASYIIPLSIAYNVNEINEDNDIDIDQSSYPLLGIL